MVKSSVVSSLVLEENLYIIGVQIPCHISKGASGRAKVPPVPVPLPSPQVGIRVADCDRAKGRPVALFKKLATTVIPDKLLRV